MMSATTQSTPLNITDLSEEEFAEEIKKGYDSAEKGELVSVEEAFSFLNEETQKTIEDANNGIGISKPFSNVKDLMDDLNSDD